MEDSKFIERIDDVDKFLSKPGRWHTTSAHQAYPVLVALGWHPQVQLGDELYVVEGSILFAEVLGIHALTPNVKKLGWGTVDDFYENRLRDYDKWEAAFWRELIQNARDARATRVDIECVPETFVDPETGDEVEAVRCSFTDNGTGMSYETLMNAFFRRGGSKKEAGSAGGFGDAKNLILTPWLGYEVASRDSVVRGRHEELFADLIQESGAQPYVNGTRVTVWMPVTKTTTPEYAQYLIEQSSLDISFTVNGKRVRGTLPKGQVVKELPVTVWGTTVGKLTVRHSPRSARHGVYVRSYGLYTFDFAGFSGDFKGVVTIDIDAPPINVFTTKRDGLSSNSSASADVTDIIQSLTVDPKTALKKMRDKQVLIFEGSGSIEVREGQVAQIAAEALSKINLSAASKKNDDGTITVDLSKIASVTEILDDAFEKAGSREEDEGPSMPPLPSTFMEAVASADFVDVEQIATAMKLALWKPDFILSQNLSPFKLPASLHPNTMSKGNHELLRVWTEICRFMMVQYGMSKSFGVGFVLDQEYDSLNKEESIVAAQYKNHNGRDWLLINPIHVKRLGYGDDVRFEPGEPRFNLSNPKDIEMIVSLAVHEITHMQGFRGHNEAYSSQLTLNIGASLRLAPVLKKIVRAAKAAVKEERAAARRAKKTSRGPSLDLGVQLGEPSLSLDEAQDLMWACVDGVFPVASMDTGSPLLAHHNGVSGFLDTIKEESKWRKFATSAGGYVEMDLPDGSTKEILRMTGIDALNRARNVARMLAVVWVGPVAALDLDAAKIINDAIRRIAADAVLTSAHLPKELNERFRLWNTVASWRSIPKRLSVQWDEGYVEGDMTFYYAYDTQDQATAIRGIRLSESDYSYEVTLDQGEEWAQYDSSFPYMKDMKKSAEYQFAVRKFIRDAMSGQD
jgi:hypothetical protein